jgi:hypothetical protein
MEGVPHEWASCKVKSGNVCDLSKDRFDFWRVFSTLRYAYVALAWPLRKLSIGMLLILRVSKKEGTYDFQWVWLFACVDLHLHKKTTMASIWVRRNIFTNWSVNER